ncbi:MAG: ketoacyl-ACP synthase III [Bacteroidota bacterium]|nr:ketoacyl-ACP synthase III [Bacteroidota bacterium]
MNASIKAISYYLPVGELTNEDINRDFPEWSIEKISEKTGVHTRHIAAENECSSDLGIESAKKLFEEHNINKNEIDFILFCTQSPDYFFPTSACLIQEKLGVPTSTGALDFNLGCSGFVYGLGLAKGLLESGTAKNILLITAETYSKLMHPKDKSVRTIIGDGAACTLISDSNNESLGPFIFGTDGKGAEKIILRAGGFRLPKSVETGADEIDEFGNVTNKNSMYMNGADVFNFTLKTIPGLVNNLYEKSGLSEDQIDLYIFHQANKYMLDALRKKLKISEEKFYIFLTNCGNTVSSTIPIALYNAIKEGKAGPGSKIMVVGFGVGLSWGAGIINL